MQTYCFKKQELRENTYISMRKILKEIYGIPKEIAAMLNLSLLNAMVACQVKYKTTFQNVTLGESRNPFFANSYKAFASNSECLPTISEKSHCVCSIKTARTLFDTFGQLFLILA